VELCCKNCSLLGGIVINISLEVLKVVLYYNMPPKFDPSEVKVGELCCMLIHGVKISRVLTVRGFNGYY
jgi:hypothetical protein